MGIQVGNGKVDIVNWKDYREIVLTPEEEKILIRVLKERISKTESDVDDQQKEAAILRDVLAKLHHEK